MTTPGFETQAIHAGQDPDPLTGAVVPPIYQTSTYKQDGVGGLRGGYEYSRTANPTRTALESCLAALENGAAALAFASGMAAEDCLIRALRLRPDWPAALDNLGTARLRQGRLEDALECYERALALQPDHAEAHRNRAMAWLARGEFERGWPEYEWRWRMKSFNPRNYSQPRWTGQPLEGKRVLLWPEQGHGDSFLSERGTTPSQGWARPGFAIRRSAGNSGTD